METFYNPYVSWLNMRVLKWVIDSNPDNPIQNDPNPQPVKGACVIAKNNSWGAPYLGVTGSYLETLAEDYGTFVQNSQSTANGVASITLAFEDIRTQMNKAIANNTPMWLNNAARAIFMSYSIPLPNNANNGLDTAWDALQVVTNSLARSNQFILAAPVEFRFIMADNAVLSGEYSNDATKRFISIEVVALVNKENNIQYSQGMLNTFANIECQWVGMGGLPHQGKSYGFYDPTTSQNCSDIQGVAPFNSEYLIYLKHRRGNGLKEFAKYQHYLDPSGVFCTKYTQALGICN